MQHIGNKQTPSLSLFVPGVDLLGCGGVRVEGEGDHCGGGRGGQVRHYGEEDDDVSIMAILNIRNNTS